MLAELGIIGFSFFLLFYIYVIGKIMYILFTKNEKNIYMICILSFFMINLWPLTSTGNFFNNWISILIYLPFPFLLMSDNKR